MNACVMHAIMYSFVHLLRVKKQAACNWTGTRVDMQLRHVMKLRAVDLHPSTPSTLLTSQHSHTHTHTHTHARAHTHTNQHTHARAHTHTQTNTHMQDTPPPPHSPFVPLQCPSRLRELLCCCRRLCVSTLFCSSHLRPQTGTLCNQVVGTEVVSTLYRAYFAQKSLCEILSPLA